MTDMQTALIKVIDEWENGIAPAKPTKPTKPTTPTKTPSDNGVTLATFKYVKDHPGCTSVSAVEALARMGFKPASTASLISAMVKQNLVRKVKTTKKLYATVDAYVPLKSNYKPEPAQGIAALHVPIKADAVNSPTHYKVGGIETIDFIEAKHLGFNLGNVVKYITRAEHKGNQLEDLQKAQWYLAREIERVQS
jgi:hypothetical protein